MKFVSVFYVNKTSFRNGDINSENHYAFETEKARNEAFEKLIESIKSHYENVKISTCGNFAIYNNKNEKWSYELSKRDRNFHLYSGSDYTISLDEVRPLVD